MDYKSKYIKYKIKYINLLGGTPKNFGVKKNSGSDNSGKYSNQCMWLSIIDYLNGVLGNNFNLDTIRAIGSNNNTKINNKTEEFVTEYHLKSLINVSNTFDLQIHLYIAFTDNTQQVVISNEPNWIIGNQSSQNVVSIVSYGSHFELITSIGDRQLYGGKIKDNNKFIPNRELALGIKINEVNKLSQSQLSRIDELLEISVNLKRVVLDLEKELKSNQLRLSDLENSFILDEKNINLSNEEAQIAIITSFQEYQIFLKKTISYTTKELNDMKKDLEIIEKEINLLVS
jgi:hypothetical protein